MWLAAASAFLGVFVKLTWELKEETDLNRLDALVLEWVSDHRWTALNGPAVDITALGSPSVLTLLVLVAWVLMILGRDRIGAIHLVVASAGAGVLTVLFKQLIGRVRPSSIEALVDVSGYSYPSGHSLGSAAIYVTIAILGARFFPRLRDRVFVFSIAVTIVAMIGCSRIYLGVHYPSDVLSGILLGTGWALALASFFTRRNIENSNISSSP